jgi:predicted Zn-dependent protease with MMP-like domain
VNAADRLRALRGVTHRWRTDRRMFERIVAEELARLPVEFRQRISNLAIVVAEWPDDDAADASDEDTDILGLYQGIPYTERKSDYSMVLPDRISIYRQPILAICRSEAEAREEIRLTVVHEVGHYFGLGDDELP